MPSPAPQRTTARRRLRQPPRRRSRSCVSCVPPDSGRSVAQSAACRSAARVRCSRAMEVSRKDLEERYAELNDEALLARYSSGTLTELAAAVARAELLRRGIPLPRPTAAEAPAAPDLATAGPLVAVATKLQWFEANILCSLLHSE